MKKVLLVERCKLDLLGGIERYNNYLIDILNKYYDVEIHILITENYQLDERVNEYKNCKYFYVDFSKLKLGKNKIAHAFKEYDLIKKTRKKFNKLLNQNRYNLIINSSFINLSPNKKLQNLFLIQHLSLDAYVGKYRTANIFVYLFYKFIKNTNLLKNILNIVVYDYINKLEFEKYNSYANYYAIPLCIEDFNNKPIIFPNLTNRQGIVYIGRINATQKNVDKLYEINKFINCIYFYGQSYNPIEDKIKNKLISQNSYCGFFTDRENLQIMLNKYKFCILYSNYEGFGFSLVEALSVGLPLIVKNTFTSASFLCNEKTGLLLPKDTTIDQDIKLIEKFINMDNDTYKQYVSDCIDFYNKNLLYKNFEEK
ncbi:glycosyltransferase [bacterium]|nr:glycosyltransferase [bacterium]